MIYKFVTRSIAMMEEHNSTNECTVVLGERSHSCPTLNKEDDSASRVHYISHLQRRRNLKPGDHIYVYRVLHLYQHHGIFTGEEGEGEVIHVSGHKFSKTSATVTSSSLSEFLSGGLLHLVSYNDPHTNFKIRGTCHTSCSRPAEDVVSTAKEFLNNPDSWGKYNLAYRNCETFAYYCKIGTESLIGNTSVNYKPRERSTTNRVQGTGPLAKHLLATLVDEEEF